MWWELILVLWILLPLTHSLLGPRLHAGLEEQGGHTSDLCPSFPAGAERVIMPVHPLEEGMAGVVFNELEEDALTVPVVS